jgi:Tfp pilus assembly protein PilV
MHDEFKSLDYYLKNYGYDLSSSGNLDQYVWTDGNSTAGAFKAIINQKGNIDFIVSVPSAQGIFPDYPNEGWQKTAVTQLNYTIFQLSTDIDIDTYYKENITITDRNQSRSMRTWAGNDRIFDSNANSSSTRIDGGLGYDTCEYSTTTSKSSLNFLNGNWVITKSGVTGFADTLTNIEKLQFTDRSVIIESQSHGSYADLPTELYQFFITAFNAAPGVTYMDQLAEAYRYGLSVKQIVDIFTTKTQFTDVYSPSLSHADMATQLVTNIVKNSATTAAKTEAIADIKGALDIGWTVGDVIYTVFGNLAQKSLTDTNWGSTAKQFNNEITVAKYYTEILNQSTTDLETLRDVVQPVTQTTNVSSDAVVAQLIGVALMTGGTGL